MVLQKQYLKRLTKVGKFIVWIVNGNHIRTHIDPEFTNFGQHYRFHFIPKNEFWIDKEYSNDESDFFIDHLLTEWKLMSKGVSYDKALERADKVEKTERAKSELAKLIKLNKKQIPSKIYRKKLKTYSHNIYIWIVNGELVRDLYFTDFTEGGHDLVYSFIPSKEVWLDDALSIREIKFVLLHELHERYLMSHGMSYEKAHRSASKIEYKARHKPVLTLKLIKKELKNNLSV